MKTNKCDFLTFFRKECLWLFCIMLGTAVATSCSKSNDDSESGNDNNASKTEWTLGVNTQGEMPYDMTLFDNTRGNVTMIKMNDMGKPERMDIISNTEANMMSVTFNDDGLVKSIGIDELTITLSNYNGKNADIAYIYKDEVYVDQEVEFDVDWNQVKQMANYDSGEAILNSSAMTRSFSTAFFSTFEAADAWLRNHEDVFKKMFFATDEVIHGKNVLKDAMSMNPSTLDKLDDIGKEMKEMTKDYAEFEIDKHLGGESRLWDTAMLIEDVKDAYKHFKEANLLTVEYDVLKMLLTNYQDYSDFCEELSYNIIEFMDTWNKPNTELADGALNSGMGDLKATLSWNFYADIDLHAYEPGDTHIYYNSKTSWITDGFLDVDNRDGGSGATENIYWENPIEGTYSFYIDYYGESTYNDAEESGNCKVTIMYKGKGNVYNISMTPDDEMILVATISLPEGTYTRASYNNNIKVDFKKVRKQKSA